MIFFSFKKKSLKETKSKPLIMRTNMTGNVTYVSIQPKLAPDIYWKKKLVIFCSFFRVWFFLSVWTIKAWKLWISIFWSDPIDRKSMGYVTTNLLGHTILSVPISLSYKAVFCRLCFVSWYKMLIDSWYRAWAPKRDDMVRSIKDE